jgi:hypothetical protein
MYNISFAKETLSITIHNQYPGLELTSPVYCSSNTTYCVPSDQQTDTNNTMEASFGIDTKRGVFKGALLYELQRKCAIRTENRPNHSTAFIEDSTTNIYLLVVWDVINECADFPVCLLECTDDFTWDEDKLWTLRHQYNDILLKDYNYRTITWLIRGDTVIKTRRDIIYGSDYKLDIVISEETGKYFMDRSMKIDPERLVLSLSMSIILIDCS